MSTRYFKWLYTFVALVLWGLVFFGLLRVLPTRSYLVPVLLFVVWSVVGYALWSCLAIAKQFASWLLGNQPVIANGGSDRTAMFATLAGFALAQGAALTVAAKGEGRDLLVVGIYIAFVIFSYAWTRQILTNGESQSIFDATTLVHGRFTLAWIVFLGCIMVGLAWYGLLPNQKSRTAYSNKGTIKCVVRGAGDYATSNEKEIQLTRSWIKWAAEGTEKDCYWIETAAGFSSNFDTFDVRFEHLPRFKDVEIVAFLRSQDNPLAMPTYRQLPVQKPPLKTDQMWMIKVTNPDKDDVIVVLCKANDTESKLGQQSKVSANDSFWLVPVF